MASYPKSGGPTVCKVPKGDNRLRFVCEDCGFVLYRNPKIVVGSVCRWEDRILLCRRGIEPQRGFWTIPAGYLELNETSMEGAAREAMEEALARIEIAALLAVYNIPRIGQVQLIYAARLLSGKVAPGEETLEARLFRRDEIPWGELAFPSVRWALCHHEEVRGQRVFSPRTNPDGELGNFQRGQGN